MSDRLPTGIVVGALLRRVNDSGGIGMVRARGDDQAGAILLLIADCDSSRRVFERGIGPDGKVALIDSTPGDHADSTIDDYWQMRRTRDPDLWVIELDSPWAERFAAETIVIC